MSSREESPITGASPADAPPADAPLRLDGAFARQDHDTWRDLATASLDDGVTLEQLARHTLDGLTVEVLYDDSPVAGRWIPSATGSHVADVGYDRALPRTHRMPDNRSAVLGGDAASANAHALAALAGGVDSLELTVRAAPDGSAAVPLGALDEALHGVHLDMITLSLRAGDEAGAALDALLALYRARGHDPASMRAALDADPLGALAREGRLDGGLEAGLERLADVAARAADALPLAHAVGIDMTVHHEAGASTVEELLAGIGAATLALESLLEAGLAPAVACRTFAFRTSCDAHLLDGVVKLRALERLWRHVLVTLGLPVVAPQVVVETSRRHLSTLEPWVNHLRNVSACTAAMIGDADTLLVHPHDRVDGRRVGDTAVVADRVARNLPLILAEEGGLADVADAAGGAHAIESLTQATVERVWQALGELQGSGGLASALTSGGWQRRLARTQAARVARLADGEAVKVGVNRYRPEDAATPDDDAPPASVEPAAATGVAMTANASAGAQASSGATLACEPLRAVREARAFEAAGTEA